jgi:predicted dinucleotide-binding enzyme
MRYTSNPIGAKDRSDHPVIKVFNNIISDSLAHGGGTKGSKGRIALPVSGDDTKAKRFVIALLDNMGFDGLEADRFSHQRSCLQSGDGPYIVPPSNPS